MKLYHGLSEQSAHSALRQGLLTRKQTKKSNWSHSVHSNPDCVYLSDAYPLYFAMQAVPDRSVRRKKDEEGVKAAIIELDSDFLNPFKLLPDEDVLEQAGRGGKDSLPLDWSMHQRTKHYRKHMMDHIGRDTWNPSLNLMGTCAHQGPITPDAFTRVAYIDIVKKRRLVWSAMDASISIANYKFCGHTYRCINAFIFDEPMPKPKTEIDSLLFNAKHIEALIAEGRDGIELINLKSNGVVAK